MEMECRDKAPGHCDLGADGLAASMILVAARPQKPSDQAVQLIFNHHALARRRAEPLRFIRNF